MIPKIIHYCWFGGNPLPQEFKRRIESWRKFCPDYEIRRWDETNFDIGENRYCREAYEAGKWAFVSDYARLRIIYDHGGIYLDTDVELIRPLNSLVKDGYGFLGFEHEEVIATGLGFGAERHNKCVERMLLAYEHRHFVNLRGNYDLTPCPVSNTAALKLCGLQTGRKNCRRIQELEGMRIYQPDYLNPMDEDSGDLNITENTYSIHYYAATWNSEKRARIKRLKKYLPRKVIHARNAAISRRNVAMMEKKIKAHEKRRKKLKVCFLIADISGNGGTERVTSIVANGLADRGYEMHIVSFRNDAKANYETSGSIKIVSFHAEKISNSVVRKVRNCVLLKNYVKKNAIDILIGVDIYIYPYVFFVQSLYPCKCVAWEHFNFHMAGRKGMKLVRDIAVRWADKVVVLGREDCKDYRNHYRKARNITYIYNPIAFPPAGGADIDQHRIIAAGRLTYQKGFDLLIDAWKKVNESGADDWILDIFGEGEDEEKLKDQIRKQRMKNVFLRGYSHKIEKEMMNSSIFALSSRYEGFVLVLLEAQAKGLPCVAFRCRQGPSEIIRDGVNGYLVDEEDTDAFAERLLSLMKDGQLRRRYAKNAGKDLGRFEAKIVLDDWEKMFQNLVDYD